MNSTDITAILESHPEATRDSLIPILQEVQESHGFLSRDAILAVGRIIPKPVGLKDGSIALRPMMGLTLSVDHRVLDGVTGARFLSDVKGFLEDPYLWL